MLLACARNARAVPRPIFQGMMSLLLVQRKSASGETRLEASFWFQPNAGHVDGSPLDGRHDATLGCRAKQHIAFPNYAVGTSLRFTSNRSSPQARGESGDPFTTVCRRTLPPSGNEPVEL